MECKSLTKIQFPNSDYHHHCCRCSSFTRIYPKAFSGCKSLQGELIIPSSVNEIGFKAFHGCESLTSIKFLQTKEKHVEQKTMMASKSKMLMTGRTIPLTKLVHTFSNCSALVSVELPNYCQVIGEGTFAGCVSLKSIVIPKSCKVIGRHAFDRCTTLSSIVFPTPLQSHDDDGNANSMIGTSATSGTLQEIGQGAFRGCNSLTTMEIPSLVQCLGFGAFENCSELTTIVLLPNATLKEIKWRTFRGCMSLQKVNFTSLTGLRKVGGCAFEECTNLETIFFSTTNNTPSSMEEIENDAFANCSKLNNIQFPTSLCRIGRNAFSGCISIKKIIFPESLQEISINAFARCSALEHVHVPNSLREVGRNAFFDCPKLTAIHLPEFVPVNHINDNESVERNDDDNDNNHIVYRTANTSTYNRDGTTTSSNKGLRRRVFDIRHLLFLCDLNRGGRIFLDQDINNDKEMYPFGLWPRIIHRALHVVPMH